MLQGMINLCQYQIHIVEALPAEDYNEEMYESLFHHYQNDPQLLESYCSATSLFVISVVR